MTDTYRLYVQDYIWAQIGEAIERQFPKIQIVRFPDELQVDEGVIDCYIALREEV
jgi:hypothetical protein